MKRRIFNAIAVVSAVLCVATVGLWVRSYFRMDFAHRSQSAGGVEIGNLGVQSRKGGVLFLFDSAPAPTSVPIVTNSVLSSNDAQEMPVTSGEMSWHRFTHFGFTFLHNSVRAPDGTHSFGWIGVPYWAPLLIFTVSAISVVLLRRDAREEGVRCKRCGYDLRATPERCPECGTVPRIVDHLL